VSQLNAFRFEAAGRLLEKGRRIALKTSSASYQPANGR
jgi:hypothetical protein